MDVYKQKLNERFEKIIVFALQEINGRVMIFYGYIRRMEPRRVKRKIQSHG